MLSQIALLEYDNTCKYLAENYPADFANWLLNVDSDIEVIKTELGLEPIRADSVTFLQVANQILHLEFQTLAQSTPPLDFRMLDYYTRLKRQYWCEIVQVVIFLQATTSELVFRQQYVDTNTRHQYRVIRLWEEDPTPLLANAALLPLATLARSDSPRVLLEQVAAGVATIEGSAERKNILACAGVLAGLRFKKDLIQQLFREEIMQESVIYQDILQKGEMRGEQRGLQQGLQQGLQRGREEGRQQGEVALILRLLTLRFGDINPELQAQISGLAIPQLEDLAEALLNFSSQSDLVSYLAAQEP